MSMGALEGLKILVTGQGGIARAIVTQLVEEGAAVALVGEHETVLGVSAQVIGPPANGDWQAVVAEATHLIGVPTVVIDVVGMPINYALEMPTAAAYTGAVLGRIEGAMNAAIPGMTAAGGGAVICVGLPMGTEMQVGIPQWSVLRHSIHGLVRG
ncbi:MAG: hypothetical protein HY782_25350 [Chloroflexi bacterium]|nr:hypothetical protein [Chloroflexota bacterium]